MKTTNFSKVPTVSISRSKFVRASQHKTSFNLGDIVPIYCDEVLPGDTRSISMGELIRMSNPIFPIMDNIYLDLYAFFVPNRLTWEHWKEFMGENTSSAGAVTPSEYSVPMASVDLGNLSAGCIGNYLGLPFYGMTDDSSSISALPLRAYGLIYNRFFRDQNIISPITIDISDNGDAGELLYDDPCLKAAKLSDYFTRSLPYAQKGSPVTIPLGTSAPVFGTGKGLELTSFDGTNRAYGFLSHDTESPMLKFFDLGEHEVSEMSEDTSIQLATKQQIKDIGGADDPEPFATADLTSATAASINQLRFAFQYQKMLEKDAMYGTRYWEILKAHFGVTAPDASLQDPEFLGHHRVNINIQQVLQTTGINQDDPESNTLGKVAANSVTGDACNLFTKSFTEHGFIMICAVARHDQSYCQGIEKMWTRTARTDYYFPVFANLGNQPVLNKEIFAQGKAADENVFGYQEAWAEYRYKKNLTTGLLAPNMADSLGYMTLSSNFGSLPTLGQTFIEQDRNSLARCLSTGETGPDFVADFAFKDIAVRPMPLYSVPGLIDHH